MIVVQMKTIATTLPNAKRDWQWPLLMAFIRLPLILAGSGVAILAYQFAEIPAGIAAGLAWSTLTLTIVNLLNLGLLVRAEDFDMKQAIGFHWHLFGRDLAMGIALSLLLGALMVSGVFALIFLLQGTNGFANLESVFLGNADFSFPLPAWLAVVSAVAFPLLNPLVEELHYRGYTQPRLAAALHSLPAGMVLTALGFGLQHMVFAVTISSALAYAAGFFLWGLGAGFMYRRQSRLVPLIIAHFISNLSFGVIPLLMIAPYWS
jgi:membrane protease YdiL (CAAX protease family)